MTITSLFRGVRFRAPLLAAILFPVAACNTSDLLDSTNSEPAAVDGESVASDGVETPSFAMAYAGGIPFGATALPTDQFGTRYNGALRNIHPNELLSQLRAIKSRGGKVALMFAGPEWLYKDGSGHFSLTKWKARVNRFRRSNISTFVGDGTIVYKDHGPIGIMATEERVSASQAASTTGKYSGRQPAITAALPPTAASGNPLASALPITTRSERAAVSTACNATTAICHVSASSGNEDCSTSRLRSAVFVAAGAICASRPCSPGWRATNSR